MKKNYNFFSYTRPDIKWYRDQEEVLESPKYHFYRAIQPSNPNIHFVRLTIVVSCLLMSVRLWNFKDGGS